MGNKKKLADAAKKIVKKTSKNTAQALGKYAQAATKNLSKSLQQATTETLKSIVKYKTKDNFKIDAKNQVKMNLYNYYVKLIFMDEERKIRLENYKNHFFDDHTNYEYFHVSMGKYQKDENNYLRLNRYPLSPDDFLYYEDPLGSVSTSEVYLVKKVVLFDKKEKERAFAMKIQKKKRAASNSDFNLKRVERDLLVGIDSPFVVKLFYSFQDRNYLFLVFELMEGTLFELIKDNFKEITWERIKFYIAEIALGIEAIHQLGYIHRDITLENVLISKEGHCKLADMGFCSGPKRRHYVDFYKIPEEDINKKYYQKDLFGFEDLEGTSRTENPEMTSTANLGTPNYMAYEVLVDDEELRQNKDNAYDHRVDWYSLGICMYYMIFLQFPFADDEEMIERLKNYETVPSSQHSNQRISLDAETLLSKLVCRVKNRISNLDDLKKNDFFLNFEWDKILDKRDLLRFKDNSPDLDLNSDKFKEFDKIREKLFKKSDLNLAKKRTQDVASKAKKTIFGSKGEIGGRKKYDWLFFSYDYLKFDGRVMNKLKGDIFRKFSRALPEDELEEKIS